jgi:hypothetical protein
VNTTEFDELVAQFGSAAGMVNGFKSEAVQLRVIDALIAAVGGAELLASPSTQLEVDRTGASTSGGATPHRRPPAKKKSAADGERPASKRRVARNPFSMVTDLDLSPTGKESLEDFIGRAQPKSHEENGVATVYWLAQIGGRTPVTQDMIFTVYRELKWTLPTDLSNVLSRTGSKGWIDPSNREDMTVTTLGLNQVEKTMLGRPPKATV